MTIEATGFDYRGATVLAAGWADDNVWQIIWSCRDGNVAIADYRVQVEPWSAKEYKAELKRQIANLRKRLARAVKREAVAV